MIASKEDYLFYLNEDRKANIGLGKSISWANRMISACMLFLQCVIGTDAARAYKLCRTLRKYEYAVNCFPDNVFFKIYKLYLKYRYHCQCVKCNVFIVPNTVGYGLKIQHIKGGGCVIVAHKVGNYFSIRQYTTVGKANGDACPVIGNNVTLGANVTIIGDITVGDNCIIGAGAVVVKDVPANSIVVGNPGKVIGQKIEGKQY